MTRWSVARPLCPTTSPVFLPHRCSVVLCKEEGELLVPLHQLTGSERNHQEQVPSPSHRLCLCFPAPGAVLHKTGPKERFSPGADQAG